ncbi:MAG: toll/interleukin-1 receptor domain-containing protein [Candidatus Nitrosocosmicus sp.]|nr:toll/interleukin-1 receptor domain-containing protein [Candidatus Nitrosocosmicus sp.]
MSDITSKSSRDIFISHAHEDKEIVAIPLYENLTKKGLNVWIDREEFQIGKNIKEMIDQGLKYCNFGIVIISKFYMQKHWTLYEYQNLYIRQIQEKRAIIIPIWHNVTYSDVEFSTLHFLKDVYALNSNIGPKALSKEIFKIFSRSRFT